MDPPELTSGLRGGGGGGTRALRILFGCCSSIVFSLVFSFLLSFVVGLVAIAIGSFSSSSPVSVPAACKILSSNVDIRSSKVCELGLLNYKAKYVFYPSGKKRFRCRDDYYWASVFEVEYREYFSGQILNAVAEAPKEALPISCRPSFGSAWSTKMKFKVNETYNCKYTLGSRKAEIYPDNLFGCQAKDPSTLEMIRRSFFLFTRSSLLDEVISGRKMAYAVFGVVSGMLISMCLIVVIKTLQLSALALARKWHAWNPRIGVFAARSRRTFLLVAYFSFMGWLTLQYGEMIGLKQLLFDSNLRDKAIASLVWKSSIYKRSTLQSVILFSGIILTLASTVLFILLVN